MSEIIKWVFKLNSTISGEKNLYWRGGDADLDFLDFGPLAQAHVEDIRYFAEKMNINRCTLVSVTKKQLFQARLADK